jgi:hypothetical protein
MTVSLALHALFVDMKFQAALVLIFLDFVLGVCAAVQHGTFRLTWIADFAKTDILFKLVPWAALALAAIYAGQQQLVLPFVDVGTFAGALYAAIVTVWASSILKSLADLGLPLPAPLARLLAPEHPPLPPTP